MIKLSELSIVDILPESIKSDPKALNAARAIDDQLKTISALAGQATFINRIDSLPSEWVDELAYQFNVGFYDPTLPLSQRRQLVKTALSIHKKRGTPAAVEELMTTIFGDGIVEEWFEYGGQPGFFRVITSNFSATTDQADRFLLLVDSAKNARSWLDSVVIRLVEDTNVYFGTAVHMGDHITLTQEALPE